MSIVRSSPPPPRILWFGVDIEGTHHDRTCSGLQGREDRFASPTDLFQAGSAQCCRHIVPQSSTHHGVPPSSSSPWRPSGSESRGQKARLMLESTKRSLSSASTGRRVRTSVSDVLAGGRAGSPTRWSLPARPLRVVRGLMRRMMPDLAGHNSAARCPHHGGDTNGGHPAREAHRAVRVLFPSSRHPQDGRFVLHAAESPLLMTASPRDIQ